ncbi:MAG: SLBB domain-containing protein [Deltaproteobacteria bacterium]|nr:SLBB domain-containing protein [Deltaproteobacteria bacterium]
MFQEPSLNGTYQLAADGSILFPLVGKVALVGMAPQEAALELQKRLAEGYLKEPYVTLLVTARNALNVHVMGQVKNSGTFQYRAGMSVIEAITTAGGFSRTASENNVRVTRKTASGEQVFDLAVGDIGKGKTSNFLLQPGDIIFVPEALF